MFRLIRRSWVVWRLRSMVVLLAVASAGCDAADMAKFKKEMERYQRQEAHHQQERYKTEADLDYYLDTVNGPRRVVENPAARPPKFNPLDFFRQKPSLDPVEPLEAPATRSPGVSPMDFFRQKPALDAVRPDDRLVPLSTRSAVPSGPSAPAMPQAPSMPQSRSLDDLTRRDGFR